MTIAHLGLKVNVKDQGKSQNVVGGTFNEESSSSLMLLFIALFFWNVNKDILTCTRVVQKVRRPI